MSATKNQEAEAGGQRADGGAQWAPARGQASEGRAIPFLTREELAGVLQVSVRTVDAMVAAGEIPTVRLRGIIVRFYLPDVVRALTATALTRKHGRAVRAESSKSESPKFDPLRRRDSAARRSPKAEARSSEEAA